MDRSEALAAAAFAAWQAHAGRVPGGSSYGRETAAAAGVTADELATAMPALDEVAARWRALPVGGSLAVDWEAPRGPSRPSGGIARQRASGRRR
ncbi:MAG: hypothetical protein WD734_04295 [Dehalococcoidia bacterium]